MFRFIPKLDYSAVEIELPSSKSISNRLLIIDFVRSGKVVYRDGLSESDDTKVLCNILKQLEIGEQSHFEVGNNGAICRFLIPLLATTSGTFVLDGDKRMRERPIKEIVDAMNFMGADISYINGDECLPIRINGNEEIESSYVELDCSRSSQFLSALILVSTRFRNGLKIKIKGEIVSTSYLMMTVNLMREFGVNVIVDDGFVCIKRGQHYKRGLGYKVEKDWSSASYWYLIAGLLPIGSSITLCGLKTNGLQGDEKIEEIAQSWGIKSERIDKGIVVYNDGKVDEILRCDCSMFPDIVPTIATACSVMNVKAELKGVEVLKYKESDRLEALITELSKINSRLVYCDNILRITPDFRATNNSFNGYLDHRLVMSFVPLVIRFGDIFIENTSIIDKSYPLFFEEISKIGVFECEY